ncbi:MAG: hypothetical protein FRX49_13727 [Trebouxia sp. A1-2]|nr:MAG: hypothetical protein FRX49_13727 [Trebouxia sp. A1-2]
MRDFHNNVKRALYMAASKGAVESAASDSISALLDLGAGRGGDYFKYRAARVVTVVAVDVAYAFALVALLAFAAPVANARSLKQDSSSITDADILNFALNLECLEAQFYSCAVYGQPLSAELTANGPAPIGCQSANFTNDDIYSIAMDVANNEIAHVNYLRTALGNYSVQCPLVNIGSAFSDAANAVLNTTLSPSFSPYVNDLYFLHGAFIFEDVGVTAYKGALTSFQSKDIMLAAAGILAVEAYHSGYIRTALIENGDVMTPYGVNVSTIVNAIAAGRDMLDNKTVNTVDDEGIYNASTGDYILTPVDGNAVAYSRTPAQVLDIVYLGSASTPGGFYPNGLNGKIH